MENQIERFRPTHEIQLDDGTSVLVMQTQDGPAYTEEEWRHELPTDYTVDGGYWYFQGQPFAGRVFAIAKKR